MMRQPLQKYYRERKHILRTSRGSKYLQKMSFFINLFCRYITQLFVNIFLSQSKLNDNFQRHSTCAKFVMIAEPIHSYRYLSTTNSAQYFCYIPYSPVKLALNNEKIYGQNFFHEIVAYPFFSPSPTKQHIQNRSGTLSPISPFLPQKQVFTNNFI